MANEPTTEPRAREFAHLLMLLAEPKRLAMLLVLADSGGEIGSGDQVAAVGLPGNASSIYAKPLLEAGLAVRRREGWRQLYSINGAGREVVEAVRRLVG